MVTDDGFQSFAVGNSRADGWVKGCAAVRFSMSSSTLGDGEDSSRIRAWAG